MGEYRTAKEDWGLVRVQTGAIGLPCPAQVEGDHDRIREQEETIRARNERIQRMTDLIGSLRCGPYGDTLTVRKCIELKADGMHNARCSRCAALDHKEHS